METMLIFLVLTAFEEDWDALLSRSTQISVKPSMVNHIGLEVVCTHHHTIHTQMDMSSDPLEQKMDGSYDRNGIAFPTSTSIEQHSLEQ